MQRDSSPCQASESQACGKGEPDGRWVSQEATDGDPLVIHLIHAAEVVTPTEGRSHLAAILLGQWPEPEERDEQRERPKEDGSRAHHPSDQHRPTLPAEALVVS